jgi:hypothetical protein
LADLLQSWEGDHQYSKVWLKMLEDVKLMYFEQSHQS